jgi:hypothetical protein
VGAQGGGEEVTEIAIKEIPVQILQMSDAATLVLRVPNDFTEEQCWYVKQPFKEALIALGKANPVVCLRENVSLAVIEQ